MKKLLTLLMLAGVFTFSANAQEFSDSDATDSVAVDSAAVDSVQAEEVAEPVEIVEVAEPVEADAPSPGFHQIVKEQFICR